MVAITVPGADPLHKVTIIPRGRALGVTQQLPVDDRHTYSREYLKGAIAVLMGGRVAEERKLGRLTTGAGNDFERATDMARKMVCEWGMSEKLGPLTFGKQEEQIFLGREIAQHRDYSEATAVDIDHEVKEFVLEGYNTARKIIEDNSDALTQIAEALLEREVLDAEQIVALARAETLPAPQPASTPDAAGAGPAVETVEDAASDGAGTKDPGVLPQPGKQPA
jgi:cell division protease FtsH